MEDRKINDKRIAECSWTAHHVPFAECVETNVAGLVTCRVCEHGCLATKEWLDGFRAGRSHRRRS